MELWTGNIEAKKRKNNSTVSSDLTRQSDELVPIDGVGEKKEEPKTKKENDFHKTKIKVVEWYEEKQLAQKIRAFLNKKVPLKVLILAILISIGFGKVSNLSNKKLNITDLYIGTYMDYYGEDKLAILSKKVVDDREIYEEINDTFDSTEVEIDHVRMFYSSLSNDELNNARKHHNKLSIKELNEILGKIEAKSLQKVEDLNNGAIIENKFDELLTEKEEVVQENQETNKEFKERTYPISSYCIGVYKNAMGNYQADMFKDFGSGDYVQYQALFSASTSLSDNPGKVKLVCIGQLSVLLTDDERKLVLDNDGLNFEQMKNIIERVNVLIQNNQYQPLNEYLEQYDALGSNSTDITKENIDAIRESMNATLEDFDYVIFRDEITQDERIVLRNNILGTFYDEEGIIERLEDKYGEYILFMDGSVMSFKNDENASKFDKLSGKDSLDDIDINELYTMISKYDLEQLLDIEINAKLRGR